MKKIIFTICCVVFVFGVGNCQESFGKLVIHKTEKTNKKKGMNQRYDNPIREYRKDYTILMSKLIPKPSSSELVQTLIAAQKDVEILAELDVEAIEREYQLGGEAYLSLEKLVKVARDQWKDKHCIEAKLAFVTKD